MQEVKAELKLMDVPTIEEVKEVQPALEVVAQ